MDHRLYAQRAETMSLLSMSSAVPRAQQVLNIYFLSDE